jgi:hypothetical protein
MALVAPEAPSEQARRVFQTYDPEGKHLSIHCMALYQKYQNSGCIQKMNWIIKWKIGGSSFKEKKKKNLGEAAKMEIKETKQQS